ncbi:MAG: DNA polymerase III subunit gamma/tau [Candidatus Dormibacteraceae bacterium]
MISTYQTLYRKYRSQTFSDLVGQEAVSRALQGAIASDRVAHAYLFSGTRGTGKTSMARLLAKSVNCTGRGADSAEPCNSCPSCEAVLAGAALDLIEIDAASNRGIDEIRDLREKVNLSPAMGRRKVYIIDEAHMLTTEAFNALLKTLEEPPEHVMFVLCTTEAQKVPLTVLGRCQQFIFRRFNEAQIGGRLAHIAGREGISAEPEALDLIARTAQGSMRDAVGLLDQLVPMAPSGITLAGARDLLGIADPASLDRLLDLVLTGDAAAAMILLAEMYQGGAELRQLVRGLMERSRDRLVAAVTAGDVASRTRLSSVLDALLHLDGEVRRHAEPRFLVEATLVRLAVAEDVPAAAPPPAPDPVLEPVPALAAAPRAGETAAVTPAPDPAPAPALALEPSLEPGLELVEAWKRVLEGLTPSVRAYFREARPERTGSVLVLTFRYAFHHQKAIDNEAVVRPLVQAQIGDVPLEFRLQDGPGAASSLVAPPRRPPAPEEHPVVQAAVRQLEGRVTKVREMRR